MSSTITTTNLRLRIPRQNESRSNKYLDILNDQAVCIPPLTDLYPEAWPGNLHESYPAVKDDVREWLQRVVPSQGYIDKLIDSDMTYLGSVFLCCGTRDMSLAYARWVHWAFLWDDVMDSTAMVHELERCRIYREQTVKYCQQALVPETYGPAQSTEWDVIDLFDDIASIFRQGGIPQGHREAILKEMINYITWTEQEQLLRHRGEAMSVAQYEEYRFHTGAVMSFLLAQPAAGGTDIPAEDLPIFYELWSQINWQVLYSNDLLSLKKEILSGQVESLVPVMAINSPTGDSNAVQRAVDLIIEKYERSIKICHQEEAKILASVSNAKRADYIKTIELAKNYSKGNVCWHYHSPRYLTAQDSAYERGAVSYRIKC